MKQIFGIVLILIMLAAFTPLRNSSAQTTEGRCIWAFDKVTVSDPPETIPDSDFTKYCGYAEGQKVTLIPPEAAAGTWRKLYTIYYSNEEPISVGADRSFIMPADDVGVGLMDTEITIGGISDQPYTGAEIKPNVQVTETDFETELSLTNGSDYTVTYSNNIDAFAKSGKKASAVINGAGSYVGSGTAEFTISPREVTVQAKDQKVIRGQGIQTGPEWAELKDAAAGHSLSSVTLTGDEAAGTITPSDAKITGGNDADETLNYEIKFVPGELTFQETFTVTWKNEDGTVLKTDEDVPYGTTPNYSGETPVKPATAEASFTFAGWSPEIADVTKDVTYTATYDAVFNGNELTCGNLVKNGSVAEGEYVLSEDCTYNGSIPLNGDVTIDLNAKSLTAGAIVCSDSSQCSLTIRDTTDIGLLNSVISVTGDLTINGGIVKASGDGIRAGGGVSFSGGQVIIEGPISAKNIDLSWTKSTDFIHAGNYSGTIKAEKPFTAFEQDWKIKYSADIGTGTVEAGQINGKWLYPPEYTVTWINDDGTGIPLKTDRDVLWGTIPVYSGKTPELAPAGRYRYSFSGWQPEISPVTGDATYTAKYNLVENIFTVTVTTEGQGIAYAVPDSGEAGTDVRLKAHPANGWRLREWRVVYGAVTIAADNTFTLGMENAVIKAVFFATPYTPLPADDNEPQTAAADKTYVIGSGEEKKFRFERRVDDGTDVAFDDFEKALNQAEGSGGIRLLINGQSLPPEMQPVLHRDYDYSRGSVIITLYPSYLDKLPVGEYTMETFFADDDGKIWTSTVHLSVTEPRVVKFISIKNDGSYNTPKDIDAAEYKLTILITAGDTILRQAENVVLKVQPDEKEPKLSEEVQFTILGEDNTLEIGADSRIVITGLPKEVIGYGPEVYDAASGSTVRPVRHRYALSVREARFTKSGEILVYLLWDDGSHPAEEVRAVPLPEDEIGAYHLLQDGTKEYLLFHTYDICMAWLGNDELCSGPERCFHKKSPYENPFVQP